MEVTREPLFGKTLDELVLLTVKLGLPGFAAKQIADWLYKKPVNSIEEMSNLSKKTRELLAENFRTDHSNKITVVDGEGNI